MKNIFIGIDLAIAKNKTLPICFCRWEQGRLLPFPVQALLHRPPRGRGNLAVLDDQRVQEFVEEAAQYISAVASELGVRVERIGIDAPRAAREDQSRRRLSEIAMDKAGISCFTTPSTNEFNMIFEKVRQHIAEGGAESHLPHANQLWMYVGFRLFERLSEIAPCIEVFPQAAARAMGAGAIHKSKKGAVEKQLNEAAQYTGWPCNEGAEVSLSEIGFGNSHDRLDAYLSAWVAALPESKRVAMGSPPHDVIWVPKIEGRKFERANALLSPASNTTEKKRIRRRFSSNERLGPSDASYELSCPGCNQHVFKRWPFGWDAHAAHKCGGLKSVGKSERKAEYREKYAHLFPGKK